MTNNDNLLLINNLHRPMKWWGWGYEDETPRYDDKPHLWPFIIKQFGLPGMPPTIFSPPDIQTMDIAPARRNEAFLADLAAQADRFHFDKLQRIVHSSGKSFRELWHARHKRLPCIPDAVFFPEQNEDIAAVIAAAIKYDIVLVPFGGGSNIVGSVIPFDARQRMVVSVDMTTMNRLLSTDAQTQTAVIQAGALGSVLEEQLNAQRFTLGHFPDSFLHSTLGGWIATRSAGMQSDEYGCIENLVLGIKIYTPHGEWNIKHFPRSAAAINLREMVLGSEGIFGIIAEATVKIRPRPAHKIFYGHLFPRFENGIAAMRHCVQRGVPPLISRLSDYERTALSFAFRPQEKKGLAHTMLTKLMRQYIQRGKRINLDHCCIMITAYEGEYSACRRHLHQTNSIYKQHHGVGIGTAVGNAFQRTKYDFPHIRDYLWDYGIYTDVSETSTQWNNIPHLHSTCIGALRNAFSERGVRGWCGCHISHSYRSGACLYFSFSFVHDPNGDNLAHYFAIKKAVQDSFVQNGGTLSHHHAVGFDHAPWLEKELSPIGVGMVDQMKQYIDPQCVMNPGKIRPIKSADWASPDFPVNLKM